MNRVTGLLLLAFCVGWTIWWGVLLARRGKWGRAGLLWFLATALVMEVAFHAMTAARRAVPD